MSKILAYGAGALAGVAVGLATLGYMTKAPAAPELKPIPKVTPMDMGRMFKQMEYQQQGRDLQSLGKMGEQHDRWILQRYGKPSSDLERLKARPLVPAKPDTRIRPRPLIFQTT